MIQANEFKFFSKPFKFIDTSKKVMTRIASYFKTSNPIILIWIRI